MSSQTIYKSYKFRLYPDADQAHTLAVWFGCVRFVKNKLISNFNSWSFDGPNRPMTEKILKDDPELPWLKEVPAVILQQARMDVDQTKKQYFNKTRKTKIGRPKYKKRSGHQSMRFPASTTIIKSFEAIKDGFIKLPLDIREWTCSNCGTHHDRDINAAINIKNQGQLDCYEQLLDQFWSAVPSDRGSWIPMRLEKYASKTERSRTGVLVGIGTDEDTRSLVVF